MFKYEKIATLMATAGFDAWGVVRAEELSDAKARFEGWLRGGNAYGLDYLHRNVDKRFDARLLLPGAKSIVVGAVSYKNIHSLCPEAAPGARVASFAHATDYHTSLKAMLREVAEGLGIDNPRSVKLCVDSVPLAEKSLAKLAGIGWIGRNSLVVSPSLGSFVVLGELVLCEECDRYSTPYEDDGCVGCGRCLLRCPTGAIRPDRSINTALCIANRTIEQGSSEGFDTKGWFFGCDECQSCCPHNASTPLFSNSRFEPLFDSRDYDSDFWAKLTPAEAESLFGTTPLMRKFKK